MTVWSLTGKGAAVVFAALFSMTVGAQQDVKRGNQKAPHQPPEWFSRMAGKSPYPEGDVDRPQIRWTEPFNPMGKRGERYDRPKSCPNSDGRGFEWC